MFLKPCLLVRDPELIKLVMIKDAECFTNRYTWFEASDYLLNKNLTMLKGRLSLFLPPPASPHSPLRFRLIRIELFFFQTKNGKL